jgi:hypothetical protein
MRCSIILAGSLLAFSAAAQAGSYRVLLQPVAGKMLVGHAGVQAVDETTATAHVRLITPGNEVKSRGTVRVLVRNLSNKPFSFGPDDVTLQLSDGTPLAPTPLDKFERGAEIVQREMGHAEAVRVQVENSLGTYAQQGGSGTLAQSMQNVPGGSVGAPSPVESLQGHADAAGDVELPGQQTVDALYQLLLPETVGPRQVWGGYYVFDLPKPVLERRSDQPLTIIVRTGGEVHRFAATLHWK